MNQAHSKIVLVTKMMFRVMWLPLFFSVLLLGGCQCNPKKETSVLPEKPASIFVAEETLSIDPVALGLKSPNVEVTATQKAVRVTLSSGILFETDQTILRPEAIASLTEIAALAKRDGARIQIEGHTDDVGTESYNLDLSYRRVQAVSEWLEGNGVDESKMTKKGYGELWPRVPNTNTENRALNRRVEMVLHGIEYQGISLEQISGHWTGSWGSLVLRKEGNRVRGTYGHDEGALIGDWRDGKLIAWWSETPTRKPRADAGEAEFTFRQVGDKFLLEGRWRKGTQGAWIEDWNLEFTELAPRDQLLERFNDPSVFVDRP